MHDKHVFHRAVFIRQATGGIKTLLVSDIVLSIIYIFRDIFLSFSSTYIHTYSRRTRQFPILSYYARGKSSDFCCTATSQALNPTKSSIQNRLFFSYFGKILYIHTHIIEQHIHSYIRSYIPFTNERRQFINKKKEKKITTKKKVTTIIIIIFSAFCYTYIHTHIYTYTYTHMYV